MNPNSEQADRKRKPYKLEIPRNIDLNSADGGTDTSHSEYWGDKGPGAPPISDIDPETLKGMTYQADRSTGQAGQSRKASDNPSTQPTADALYPQAMLLAIKHGYASTSLFQRGLRISYAWAYRIVERMENEKFVELANGSTRRKLVNKEIIQ